MPELNSNYLQTIFRVDVSLSDLPARFAVVTAHNPNGILHSADQNKKFDEEFHSVLQQGNIRHSRVTGSSPDFQHAEPGFAVEVSLEEALALANRWQQEAIFWIEDGSLLVISCDGKHRLELGSWTSRQANNITQKANDI